MRTAALTIDWFTGECWINGQSGTRYRVSDVERWERQARQGDAAARARLDSLQGDLYPPVTVPTETDLILRELMEDCPDCQAEGATGFATGGSLIGRPGHAEQKHRPSRGRR